MIKTININQYRKLKDMKFELTPYLNAISGTNGTCKTSLLHMISNSCKAVTKTSSWVKDKNCLQIINSVNDVTNPKVESLTRGDKQYNDPAHGVSGVLFNVEYFDHTPLDFRRHNSSTNTRYAIKPMYQRGSGDSLPSCPVIYLGLSRLMPYGEFKNDAALKDIKKGLPDRYQAEIARIYEDFTHYSISPTSIQQMGDVKTRAEFSSAFEGIDSNTISAGEDNLYIILLAVMSLRYYYESIESYNTVESILLVDELDATLHPAYQIKLLNLLREYSKAYKIQIVFTTHSMSMIEELLCKKDNVFYLLDNITSVVLMEDPDLYKIRMHLSSLTKEDIYLDKVIPVFTEDAEARFMLDMLLKYYEDQKAEFRGVRRFFHFVNVNLGADNLRNIFEDLKLLRSTMKAICVLDGDHNTDLSNNIVALPGKNTVQSSGLSPEKLLVEYAEILFHNDDPFWVDNSIISIGYGKQMYIGKIVNEIQKYKEEQQSSVKEREFYKKLFNDNKAFFELLFKHWLNNKNNKSEKYRFYKELRTLFIKNSRYNDINPAEWPDDSTTER